MKFTEIRNERSGERYYKGKHETGLTIYVYPKEGYHSTYAIFGTKYGSVNMTFQTEKDEEPVTVPAGIAHYLEHKLFESEDGDAFAKYAKTGASANAYTSFDVTCYLFSCTEKMKESLKILLDFVQAPYFTEQTVQKEQGIIGQEIRMYDDSADWRVMFNLLEAMYHNHPVKIDIAGTVESIAKITADTLYQCYNTFYNLSNMALCVAGNVSPEDVEEVANECLKQKEPVRVQSFFPDEPRGVVKERVEQQFEIAVPMFQLGFKEEAPGDRRVTDKELAETDILLEVLSSKSSPLYQKLMDEQLINTASFGYEYFEGPGYASIIFSGESRDPDRAAALIREAADKLHKDGIDEEAFRRSKKAVYGRTLSMLNSAENIANAIVQFAFSERELYSYLDAVVSATPQSVAKRLENELLTEYSALSVVTPIK